MAGRTILAGAVFAGAALWAAWLMVMPALAANAGPGSAAAVASAVSYRLGSLVCHQRASRSLHLGAVQLPVCARCVGLYSGAAIGAGAALIGLVAAGVRRRSGRVRLERVRLALILSAMPTAFLWIGEYGLGIGVTGPVRTLGALPLGATVAWLATALVGGRRVTGSAGPGSA
ncbi:MAG: DUF2085 domain-containing protein [Acidobacteriota bacterium]